SFRFEACVLARREAERPECPRDTGACVLLRCDQEIVAAIGAANAANSGKRVDAFAGDIGAEPRAGTDIQMRRAYARRARSKRGGGDIAETHRDRSLRMEAERLGRLSAQSACNVARAQDLGQKRPIQADAGEESRAPMLAAASCVEQPS